MQSFQINNGPPPGPRNFVFVDEHNRHKRLKVMRACEGCRRRKIKCDAATTNTWPCAACKRLKLPCVPPAGGLDFDNNPPEDSKVPQQPQSPPLQTPPPQNPATPPVSLPFDTFGQFPTSPMQNLPNFSPDNFSPDEIHATQQAFLQDNFQYMSHAQLSSQSLGDPYDQHYAGLDGDLTGLTSSSMATPHSPDNHTAESLVEQLGSLRIEDSGVAPYARQQKAANEEPEGPIQEKEIFLPQLSTAAGGQIRIPPALMPDDHTAEESFRTFFEHVHPYVPVLCRSQFYNQWHNDRDSLSPLLLEAMFACAGRISGKPVEGSPWLALANKHEASFLDEPRLSTVQALLLLMKAREASPKRGYFYKSWMTIKTAITMAIDLELHEHLSSHNSGPCEFGAVECMIKTRTWQTIMILELMVGAPQGRTNFEVKVDTVEFTRRPPVAEVGDFENMITRQYTTFIENARNIRSCVETYVRVRKNKDWALDPVFDELMENFSTWHRELPDDLQLPMPSDDGKPHLPSHFVGNMHNHYQLGIIMLYRPQIVALAKLALFDGDQWRRNMSLCYRAAKQLCLIQEAMVDQYEMVGLLCMQRGMSYTIYAILTCIMLHLIAITSPDPEFNYDSREYFVRHMRLLEKCMPEWPMAETDKQINNLRAAFSADLDLPFDLKPSFPYGSPSSTSSTLRRESDSRSEYSPPPEAAFFQQPHFNQGPEAYYASPPQSSLASDSKSPPPQFYSNYGVTDQSHQQYQQVVPGAFPQQQQPIATPIWNPSPIIDSFNTAFAIPPSALQDPSSLYGTSPSMPMTNLGPQHLYNTSPETPTYDLQAFTRHQAQAQAELRLRAQVQAQVQAQAQMAQMQSQQQSPGVSGSQQQPNYFDPSGLHHIQHTISAPQTYATNSQQMHNPSANMTDLSNPNMSMPGMVYVSAKEWQQSVASVYDPAGLKRRWT